MAIPHGRRWEPRRIRFGNGSKNIFSCTCSKCGWIGTFDSLQNLPDEVVSKKFSHFGWLLGRSNAHNICKRCLSGQAGVQPKNELANVFRVVENGVPVPPSKELRARVAKEIVKHDTAKRADLDDIINRHFPKKPLEESVSETETETETVANPEISGDLLDTLKGIRENMGLIASELGNVRAALELQAEQTSYMVANTSNQIKALTILGPLIAKTTEAVGSGFADQQQFLLDMLKKLPSPSRPEPQIEPQPEPSHSNISLLKKVLKEPRQYTHSPKKAVKGRTESEVSIYSNAVKTGSSAGRKWSTTIRVSRDLWDAADLNGQERVVVTQKNGSIKVSKPKHGDIGIKVKKLSEMVAVLQVSTLGDINTKDMSASVGNGSLTLRPA
jgi:hypothetical protein